MHMHRFDVILVQYNFAGGKLVADLHDSSSIKICRSLRCFLESFVNVWLYLVSKDERLRMQQKIKLLQLMFTVATVSYPWQRCIAIAGCCYQL